MYAYVKVIIERPDVQALPLKALVHSGAQTFCWLYESGKAVRTEVETGVSDDKWIEVTDRRRPVPPEAPSDSVRWTAIDGREQVIVGDLSGLVDGAVVHVAPATPDTNLASDTPASDLNPNTRQLLGDARLPDTSRAARRLP
jgi:HlyD family secretion protein